MNDQEWQEFEDWWHSKWGYDCPKRSQIETFLEWRECRVKGIDWKWSFEKKKTEEVNHDNG